MVFDEQFLFNLKVSCNWQQLFNVRDTSSGKCLCIQYEYLTSLSSFGLFFRVLFPFYQFVTVANVRQAFDIIYHDMFFCISFPNRNYSMLFRRIIQNIRTVTVISLLSNAFLTFKKKYSHLKPPNNL